MRIFGEWFCCEDGIMRPTIRAGVLGADGQLRRDRFLVDPGADRTVFSAELSGKLGLSFRNPSEGEGLKGISGQAPFVVGSAILEFIRDDEGTARVRGEYAAFTDPDATDLSILGRDVLDNFDVIISKRRNEILLLAPNHQYRIE